MPKYTFPCFAKLKLAAFLLIATTALYHRNTKNGDSNQTTLTISPCEEYFLNETDYFNNSLINTFLINSFAIDQNRTINCLDSLTRSGDHLLSESDIDQPCNSKLNCHRFNFSMDEKSRVYDDLVYKIHFLTTQSSQFFIDAKSDKTVIERMYSFADRFASYQGKDIRFAKYLRKLARSMGGLSISGMEAFLRNEKDRLSQQAAQHKGKLSNQPLVDEVISHRKQLPGQQRLFVIAQTNLSSTLREKFAQNEESLTVLTSKQC